MVANELMNDCQKKNPRDQNRENISKFLSFEKCIMWSIRIILFTYNKPYILTPVL